ncbi:MAG: polysaccharide biosynthesis/export family protein, partial [Methylobacter sp.]|nr:polysaccharide biosynthesis/export family protein [Methylobacter sp.]
MFRSMFRSMSLIPVLLLQACASTPGMEMEETNGPLSHIEVPVMKDGKLVKEKAQISQITADLIIERENSKQREINNLPSQNVPMTEYRIGPHDRLQITVWEHPELNDPGGEKIDP